MLVIGKTEIDPFYSESMVVLVPILLTSLVLGQYCYHFLFNHVVCNSNKIFSLHFQGGIVRESTMVISKGELEKLAGVFCFPSVSGAAASADYARLDPNITG